MALYETWIRRSCEGYADAVLVAETGGGPAGYITCHLSGSPPAGSIGLVGVGGDARGAGTGTTLVGAAIEWFQGRGVQEVSVVTQGRNLAAQRLYQRAGFRIQAVELWYHKWFPAPDSSRE